MKTKTEYLDGKISHREYYAQFITPKMIERVKTYIGVDVIKASTDEHLNDIPMELWDGLSGIIWIIRNGSQEMATLPTVSSEFKKLTTEASEGMSPSTLVCVYKEIARQLAEGKL